MSQSFILVTGATGTVGREVVKQLVDAGHKVRALTRAPAKVKFAAAVEVVRGDLAEPATLTAAFTGIDKAFVLSNGAEIAELEANAFAAAKQAGVKHIVKLSGRPLNADFIAGTPLARAHNASEDRLRALGIPWTILRPGYFSSNVLMMGVLEQGGLFLPAGDGKDTPIDPRDIAAVAVKALTTQGHEGKVYELTGPQALSHAEMVEKLAAATGKPLQYVDVPEAEARARMLANGAPVPYVDTLLRYFGGVKAGRLETPLTTVADLLGRPARTFDDWLRDHLALFQ